ncbi:hypothetical protein QBC39DRAFT_40349 [Podospora conica]|nr:hypothetical protein QBC39DRAFT_40349 [Schizothecium conicum]
MSRPPWCGLAGQASRMFVFTPKNRRRARLVSVHGDIDGKTCFITPSIRFSKCHHHPPSRFQSPTTVKCKAHRDQIILRSGPPSPQSSPSSLPSPPSHGPRGSSKRRPLVRPEYHPLSLQTCPGSMEHGRATAARRLGWHRSRAVALGGQRPPPIRRTSHLIEEETAHAEMKQGQASRSRPRFPRPSCPIGSPHARHCDNKSPSCALTVAGGARQGSAAPRNHPPRHSALENHVVW